MSSLYTPTSKTSFTLFPSLPTELRLKIWSHLYETIPPRLIPFHLHKSDLDYLRLRRKACQNYPHIFCSSVPIPPILHACRESRAVGIPHYTLGFDISRILSMGKADTDVDMYTTCGHEVASHGERETGVYWDRSKDVVYFDTGGWKEEAALTWGGKTGVRFGKIGKVAMDFDTLTACGIGEYVDFEGVDEMFILGAGLEDPARVIILLASKGLVSCVGGPVNVNFDFDDARRVVDYIARRDSEPSTLPPLSDSTEFWEDMPRTSE